MLLEREDDIAALQAALARVRDDGEGLFAVVSGEAGAGKTTLVRRFVTGGVGGSTVLWGACDSLRTPRPLGPLADIAMAIGGPLATLLADGGTREAVFAATLQLLSETKQPLVVVVEDAHWADEATVDLLTFLRRRVSTTRALVVLTYRDDEVRASHPLRAVLGEANRGRDVRLEVKPLSVEAVGMLAEGRAIEPAALHEVTGGNPFFVTEALAIDTLDVPPTVRDAVLARAARLSVEARRVLAAVAIVPSRAELWLIDALVPDAEPGAVDECIELGMLDAERDHLSFRHELARLAVRDSVPPERRRELHRLALARLVAPPSGAVDEARASYHAEEAGDVEGVLAHAPIAAERAARMGAHREAVGHLTAATAYAERLAPTDRIDLLGRLAFERQHIADMDGCMEALDAAIELCRELGDDARRGELVARSSGVHTMMGREVEAKAAIEAAFELVEPKGPSPSLAFVLAQRSAHHMLARHFAEAELWGQRAIELSTELGCREHLCYALIQSGIAVLMDGNDEGHERIRRGIAIAREEGWDRLVALGLSQIGSGGGEVRRYELAVPALEDCIAFSRARELFGQESYASSWLARCWLEQGRWREAGQLADDLLVNSRHVGIARMVALIIVGRLRARRDDPGVWQALDDGLAVARESGHLQRLWPAAAARAEAAWLAGDLEPERALLEETYELALRLGYPWALGELGWWLHQGGWPVSPTPEAAGPYAPMVEGRLDDAIEAFEVLGCDYEAALARLALGGENAIRAALATFEQLGAPAATRRAAAKLRALGVTVPRGPNTATRSNPAGLTARELEVLELLVEGLRNAEISQRLSISRKTVDHHVSSVLAKLGVPSRQAAATAVFRLGLVPK